VLYIIIHAKGGVFLITECYATVFQAYTARREVKTDFRINPYFGFYSTVLPK